MRHRSRQMPRLVWAHARTGRSRLALPRAPLAPRLVQPVPAARRADTDRANHLGAPQAANVVPRLRQFRAHRALIELFACAACAGAASAAAQPLYTEVTATHLPPDLAGACMSAAAGDIDGDGD